KSFNGPMINLTTGILDLSSLSFQDLKLLGIHYANTPYSQIPPQVNLPHEPEFQGLIPDSMEYQEKERAYLARWSHYFKVYQFDIDQFFEDIKLGKKTYQVSDKDIKRSLLGLKILKATHWLDLNFPLWHTTILTTQSFLEKLSKGRYRELD